MQDKERRSSIEGRSYFFNAPLLIEILFDSLLDIHPPSANFLAQLSSDIPPLFEGSSLEGVAGTSSHEFPLVRRRTKSGDIDACGKDPPSLPSLYSSPFLLFVFLFFSFSSLFLSLSFEQKSFPRALETSNSDTIKECVPIKALLLEMSVGAKV